MAGVECQPAHRSDASTFCGSRSARRSRGTRRTVEHGGHVLQQLEPPFEGAALDQVEPDVGISVIDPILAGRTGHDREDDNPEAIYQFGRDQRSARLTLPSVRSSMRLSSFIARTACTASSVTSRVLAHPSGSVRVEEKTTFARGVSIWSTPSS